MNDSMNGTVKVHYSVDHRLDCTGVGSETLPSLRVVSYNVLNVGSTGYLVISHHHVSMAAQLETDALILRGEILKSL